MLWINSMKKKKIGSVCLIFFFFFWAVSCDWLWKETLLTVLSYNVIIPMLTTQRLVGVASRFLFSISTPGLAVCVFFFQSPLPSSVPRFSVVPSEEQQGAPAPVFSNLFLQHNAVIDPADLHHGSGRKRKLLFFFKRPRGWRLVISVNW